MSIYSSLQKAYSNTVTEEKRLPNRIRWIQRNLPGMIKIFREELDEDTDRVKAYSMQRMMEWIFSEYRREFFDTLLKGAFKDKHYVSRVKKNKDGEVVHGEDEQPIRLGYLHSGNISAYFLWQSVGYNVVKKWHKKYGITDTNCSAVSESKILSMFAETAKEADEAVKAKDTLLSELGLSAVSKAELEKAELGLEELGTLRKVCSGSEKAAITKRIKSIKAETAPEEEAAEA